MLIIYIATEYIPSGRPGGKSFYRTLRDYLFIGEGSKARMVVMSGAMVVGI